MATTATQPQKPEPQKASKPGEYHLARAIGVCAVSGRVITAGEKLMATVRETLEGL
jgi:hypothetical protein